MTPEQQAALEVRAAQAGRSVADVARQMIVESLEHDRWLAEAIERGRDAARRGSVLTHEDVVKRIEDRYR